ncbi:MAG TPA: DUF3592 domain-containing protein [Verrucomicrobiae bacterium]|nr:DUF3592 domain-containing protein [Verrucomicrobiae bacterium]
MAKTGKPSRPSWLFTGIFLLIGLGLLGGGAYSGVSTFDFLANAVSAPGVVIDLEARWDSDDGGYTYYPRVRFATEGGRPYEFTGDVGSSPASFDVGEEVRVLFDPADPSKARIDSFMQLWFTPLLLAGMGTVFSIFGLWGTLTAARESLAVRGAPRPEPPKPEPARPPVAEKSSMQNPARRESVIQRQNRD